jgi:hypothetical protein
MLVWQLSCLPAITCTITHLQFTVLVVVVVAVSWCVGVISSLISFLPASSPSVR